MQTWSHFESVLFMFRVSHQEGGFVAIYAIFVYIISLLTAYNRTMGRQEKHLTGTARRILYNVSLKAGWSMLRMNVVDRAAKGLLVEYECCCRHRIRSRDWRSLQDYTEKNTPPIENRRTLTSQVVHGFYEHHEYLSLQLLQSELKAKHLFLRALYTSCLGRCQVSQAWE